MKIESAVLDVLGNAVTEGNSLKLTGQLDRPLYVAVNKVLEAAGGKWNRKAQAHLFEGDAAEIMDAMILTGNVTNKKQELGFFPTPPAIVARMIEAAQIEPYHRVLEPSAGTGSILRSIIPSAHKTAIEINPEFIPKLALCGSGLHVIEADFLTWYSPERFERIVMNPPFAKNAAPAHVLKALTLLSPKGGRIVAIMPSSVTFRTDTLNRMVRAAIDCGGNIEALPENSFAESGTGVNTVMVTIDN